jgi:serine/threonine protein kinase
VGLSVSGVDGGPKGVIYTGAYIGFAGAVYTDGPNAEVLSTMVPLCVPETEIELRTQAARHFGAFKKAVISLRQYYTHDLEKGLDSKLDPRYPYKRSYKSLQDSTECGFEYMKAIDGGKLIFMATTEKKEIVCVKFSRTYSQEAQTICASMGCAPKVRGFEQVAGGWYMVVMDYIGEEYGALGYPSGALYELMKPKLIELHQRGYVHGDLRDTNVMVRKEGKPGVMMIDFEWSGRIGEVRYPMYVNREEKLRRPEGAVDGELILAEHDVHMLDVMFER